MLLAIDIGNSNIVFGIFKGKTLIKTCQFQTKYPNYSKNIIPLKKSGIKNIIISSVVPSATKKLKRSLKKILKIDPIILGRGKYIVPIKNLYKNPKEVGQDRLVNSFAAKNIYGYPIIVVDFGTAITFDIVSKKGEYLGGLIFPGLELSLKTLSQNAALLPKIKLQKPKKLIGNTTVESMRSGVYHGTAALCDGVIEKLNKLLKQNFKVASTGGHSEKIAKFCKNIDKVDSNLTLKGLRLIFNKIYQNS